MTARAMEPKLPTESRRRTRCTRRRRILFRATHRGTHENDILIGGFVTPAHRRLLGRRAGRAGGAHGAARRRSRRLADGPPRDSARVRQRRCCGGAGGRPGAAASTRWPLMPAKAVAPAPPSTARRKASTRCCSPAARWPSTTARCCTSRATMPAWPGWPTCSPSSPRARGPALPGLGLPALRPRLAQPGDRLRAHRHPDPAAGAVRRAAHRAHHRERAGAARAAAPRLRRPDAVAEVGRTQPDAPRSRS